MSKFGRFFYKHNADSVIFLYFCAVFNLICFFMSKISFVLKSLMAVYPIVDGCSRESIFEGTSDECKDYVHTLFKNKPEMRDNIIVLDIYD